MADLTIHTYTAAEGGLFVNSYLLETPAGVVIIDTNLLVADIAALSARLAALHKPLLGVFITHPHPDHFNGALELVSGREVPVYATAAVARAIREVADAKRAQWRPLSGAQWPTETYSPNSELGDGQQVMVDGLAITARQLGPGESHADSWLLVRPPNGGPLAFTGDLAFHHTHPYTADGHTTLWLATLDRLAGDLERSGVGRLLPGHGAGSGPGLLAEQRRYLLCYREVVRRLADGAAELSDVAKADLEAMMRRFLPDAPLSWMIGLGATWSRPSWPPRPTAAMRARTLTPSASARRIPAP